DRKSNAKRRSGVRKKSSLNAPKKRLRSKTQTSPSSQSRKAETVCRANHSRQSQWGRADSRRSGFGACLWPSLGLRGSTPGKKQHHDAKGKQSHPRIEINVHAQRTRVDLLIAKQTKHCQDHTKQAEHPSYRITNIQTHRASPIYLKIMLSTSASTRTTPPR